MFIVPYKLLSGKTLCPLYLYYYLLTNLCTTFHKLSIISECIVLVRSALAKMNYSTLLLCLATHQRFIFVVSLMLVSPKLYCLFVAEIKK